jgi:hypothetical protein
MSKLQGQANRLPLNREPAAVNCVIDYGTAAVTVNEDVPIFPRVALIVTGPPVVMPVAKPAVLMIVSPVFDDVQVLPGFGNGSRS